MPFCRLGLLAALLTSLCPLVASAQSIGPWHMPSTCAQFFGCRFGPGHHAPIVRTPGHPTQHTPRFTYQQANCHCYTQPAVHQYWAPQPATNYQLNPTPANQPLPDHVEPTPAPELIQPAAQLPPGQHLPAHPQQQFQNQSQWQQAQTRF